MHASSRGYLGVPQAATLTACQCPVKLIVPKAITADDQLGVPEARSNKNRFSKLLFAQRFLFSWSERPVASSPRCLLVHTRSLKLLGL